MRTLIAITLCLVLSAPSSAQWTQLADFQSSTVPSIVTDGSRIFALVQGSGVQVSNDDGATWTPLTNNLSAGNNGLILVGDTLWAFGTQMHKMHKDDTIWTLLPAPPSSATALHVGFGGLMLMAKTSPGMHRSIDFGATWDTVNLNAGTVVYALGAAGTAILAGTDGDVWRSTIAGTSGSWTRTYNGSAPIVKGFHNHLGGTYVGSTFGPMRSTDTGVNWTLVNTNAFAMVIAVGSTGPTIIAGGYSSGGAVFTSDEPTGGWTNSSAGLPNTLVQGIAVRGGFIFAATSTAGIWRRPVSEVTAVREGDGVPSAFALDQNYPNPFNPSTTIRFHLPEGGPVSLVVTDLQGREVARLVDENLPAGSWSVTWDARGVASGVYTYRLVAGEVERERKMVVVR